MTLKCAYRKNIPCGRRGARRHDHLAPHGDPRFAGLFAALGRDTPRWCRAKGAEVI